MSYIRNSTAFIYHDVGGYLCCMSCPLPDIRAADGSYKTTSRRAMIAHIHEHLAAGFYVPVRAEKRLRREIETERDGV